MLDFDVFSNQKWDRLGESHANDIIVTWPDGHETQGIAKHIEDLKAVTGYMTGTFSKPMPIDGGKTIPPTGNSFRLGMVTIGHWKGGTMDQEWLFWDSQDFMKRVPTRRRASLCVS